MNDFIIIDLSPQVGISRYVKKSLKSIASTQNTRFEWLKFDNINTSNILRSFFKVRNSRELFNIIIDIFKIIYTALYVGLFSVDQKKFQSRLLKIKFRGIEVGDCLLSAYFRSIKTPVYPNISFFLLKHISLSLMIFSTYERNLSRLILSSDDRLLLFLFETTGREEYVRRSCLLKGVDELRFSPFYRGFRIFSGFNGVEFCKSHSRRKFIYDKLLPDELEKGSQLIEKLTYRKETYEYLKISDLNTDLVLDLPIRPPKTSVVVFLATLSDAQYMYGVGPFSNLIDFHENMIFDLLDKGYEVIVKPHPSMLKKKDYAEKDRSYYSTLMKRCRVVLAGKNIFSSQNNERLKFVDPKLPIVELSRVFPQFLCITQHGSVAAECAFLGHFCIVASNSQYMKEDAFVNILSDKNEVNGLLEDWREFSGPNYKQSRSLFSYVYVNNIGYKKLYGTRIMSGLVPVELDSSHIENWIQDFEYGEPDAELKLTEKANKNLSKLNNDFTQTIHNKI